LKPIRTFKSASRLTALAFTLNSATSTDTNMAEQQKDNNLLKREVQKRYQQELTRYQKQIEKTKKVLVHRSKTD
jgi:hypothetical protein